jgi:triacylglycerol esterase/lipase EstA (alpha/beta hydrolase family)
MMPRYYIKYLGGAAKVDKLVALAPSNNGTTLDGITQLGIQLNLIDPINGLLGGPCAACVEQEAGSPFLTALNAGGETVPGVQYTVIESADDEVVTPPTSRTSCCRTSAAWTPPTTWRSPPTRSP